MSESDLDLLYQRASGHDAARPSTAAREVILERARMLAAHAGEERLPGEDARPRTPQRQSPLGAALAELSRRVARWPRLRWQIAAPVAAAALALIVWQPQLRSRLPAPASKTAAPAAAPAAGSEPARSAPAAATAEAPVPAPSASNLASNLASGAELAPAENRASAPRTASAAAAAPRAQLREREVAPPVGPATPSELLHEAAARGDVSRVRSVLRMYNVAINAVDADGRTALMLAVLHGQEAVVRELLGRGADPNIADTTGRTPLEVARDRNELSIFDVLLQAGAR